MMNTQDIELYSIGILSFLLVWSVISTIRYYKRKKRYVSKLHRYAKQDDPISQRELAEHYRKGDMVRKDCMRAYFWYKKAAYGGDETAQGYLKRFVLDRKRKSCPK